MSGQPPVKRSSDPSAAALEARSHGPSAHGPDCPCPRCRGFEPGHALSLRHGFYATPRLRAEDAAEVDEIVAAILDAQPPELHGARFDLAREMCAARVWQARRAYADLADNGLVRGEGREPAPILRYLGTLERTLQRDMESLGLTPRAMAELGLDMARTGEALRAHLAETYAEDDS